MCLRFDNVAISHYFFKNLCARILNFYAVPFYKILIEFQNNNIGTLSVLKKSNNPQPDVLFTVQNKQGSTWVQGVVSIGSDR